MTTYNGKIPWWAYEVKLDHMALKHQWDNPTKLAKLVEALEDNALTFYSSLDARNCNDYYFVCQKFNAWFGPKEPPCTARNQLAVLQQGLKEGLEEFAEQAMSEAFVKEVVVHSSPNQGLCPCPGEVQTHNCYC